jgi:hypothetical protein
MSCRTCSRITMVEVNPVGETLPPHTHVQNNHPQNKLRFMPIGASFEDTDGTFSNDVSPSLEKSSFVKISSNKEVPFCQGQKLEFKVKGEELKEKPKSFEDIQIPPALAPDILEVRDQTFKDTLVEIEAAAVVQGFCEDKPLVPEDCPNCDCNTFVEEKCVNHHASHAHKSEGCPLEFKWLDALESKCMTLLGRNGRTLSRLVGEGFLKLDCDGLVCATKDIPLRVSKLWHQWFKPTPTSAPIIGQPMPFSYQVITDIDGDPYVIRGLANEDSITVWKHGTQQFEQTPITDFPLCTRRITPAANRLELVGFEPLGISDDPSLLRCLKRIQGDGMLRFRSIETTPTQFCQCSDCSEFGQTEQYTTIAEFVPYPAEDCTQGCPWVWGYVNGLAQWVNPIEFDCFKGAKGDPGVAGAKGATGDNGFVTTYNDCCTNGPSNL